MQQKCLVWHTGIWEHDTEKPPQSSYILPFCFLKVSYLNKAKGCTCTFFNFMVVFH